MGSHRTKNSQSTDTLICKKCNIEKYNIDFRKNRKTCKGCENKISKEYNLKNRETINKREIKYRELNKEKIKIKNKKYLEKNRENIKIKKKNYRIENKEKIKEYNKFYIKNNRDKINKRQIIYMRRRLSENIKAKLKHRMSSNINKTLKNRLSSKNGRKTWSNILGYSVDDFIKNIESKFEAGMTWENYGHGLNRWSIDHITPDSWFKYDSVDHEDFKKSWVLKNLQPMWFDENCKKRNLYSGK